MIAFSRRISAFIAAASLTACAAQSSIPSPHVAGAPLAARAAKLSASPSKLDFTTTPKLTLTVSEKGYTGAFTFSVVPANLVKFKPAKGKGPSTKVTMTAANAGKGTFTATDANGNAAKVPVTVTQGVIVIQ